MPIDEFIIRFYCLVCEGIPVVTKGRPLRQRGFQPALTDAEVLTMEFVGAYQGLFLDKSIWGYFHQHWLTWFPHLGSRSNFVRQASNLWMVKHELQRQLGAFGHGVHLVDGFPVPVFHFRRAHFSQIFGGEAAYGFCASKGQTYYGFRGILLTNDKGVISDSALVAANVDERDAIGDLLLSDISGTPYSA